MSPFNILIIGSGPAGLMLGIALAHNSSHKITILEKSHALSPIGVGIHVPPNSTRVLRHLGLLSRLEPFAMKPAGSISRRYKDGSLIADVPGLNGDMPYWTIKRSDYQQILADIAKEVGCEIRLSCQVESCNEAQPSVVLSSGEMIEADIIIGADGIKSTLRNSVVPEENTTPITNRLSTYRGTVTRTQLESSPVTQHLAERPCTQTWSAYNRHFIMYPISHGEAYSLGGTHPPLPLGHKTQYPAAQSKEVDDWNCSGSTSVLQEQFKSFEPAVRKVLDMATEVREWPLAEVPVLPRWRSASGRVVLMGDAAHATFPFLGQGAAMAIEDGIVLAECLNRAKSANDISQFTLAYERIRKRRAEKVSNLTRRNGEVIHLPDGEDQEARDAAMAGTVIETHEGWPFEADAGPMADDRTRKWLFGYDALASAKLFLSIEGH